MIKLLWIGIRKTDGHIEARRYSGEFTIQEARRDPHIEEWTDPYDAIDRNAATNVAINLLKRK